MHVKSRTARTVAAAEQASEDNSSVIRGGVASNVGSTGVEPDPPKLVVMKLKPAIGPRLERSLSSRGPAAVTISSKIRSLESLISRGAIDKAEPVFPSSVSLAERRSVDRAGMAVRHLAASALTPMESWEKRSRGLMQLKIAPGVSPAGVARELEADPTIEYAYVPAVKHLLMANTSRRRATQTNDPLSSRQWNHVAVRIYQARASRRFVDADAVKVAVVDSGVDPSHEDLQAVIAEYLNFTGESRRDYSGHGTHVSGIIAANINNRVGISGLCRAQIVSCKALPHRADWNAAAYYRALGHAQTSGCRVLNLSIGGQRDRGEEDVILDLIEAGVTVVAAMGNEYEQGNAVSYPAAYDGVIAVGATDQVDRRASFSNTGRHISLSAPGVSILSTVPRNGYEAWDGTSMATPHVAAAAALFLARDPSATPAQVRQALMAAADRVPGQTGFNRQVGAGRLNIERLLSPGGGNRETARPRKRKSTAKRARIR